MSSNILGNHPQGAFIKLYGDDNKAEEYELHSIHYALSPIGVAVCTYNTPKNLHALSTNQQWETFALLDHMARDDNVRVCIWTGSGDRAFNVGADLSNSKDLTMPEHIRDSMAQRNMAPVEGDFVLASMTKAFWDFPKPSICAVNGMAVGGAANIALVNFHDLVIASENSKFTYPFPKLGFTPELGSSFMMPFLIGMAKAKELMFLADWFSAKEAASMGLVNKVVPHDKLMEEANALAERLVMFHPAALKHSKKILNHHIRKQLDTILDDELDSINASLIETRGPGAVKKWMAAQKIKIEEIKSKL